ncbi:hypothetical protein BOTBODRAFT_133293 [Botryobasidium botryosum FD-172 SS1]|uniref:Actin cytoskeleton-regulatory complex protein SLA1 n=1 Tax=Botryobasidium botryosum (strain FD-172 SS1) TaxID=930990 RepID=A0A067MG87_BOTB1|nr:hypothetical protein BOTBODRAFT_133293 [Botryobasidium botryosum FD-172 SS1]
MATAPTMNDFISLVKANFDYTAQSDDELSIAEEQLLFLVENDDPEWWKVKVKSDAGDNNGAVGLVPASYLEEAVPIFITKALYDYEASADGELSVKEDESLRVYEMEDDWWLAKSDTPGGRLGYVPGTYCEAPTTTAVPDAVSSARPTSVYSDPGELVAASSEKAKADADAIQTWAVAEVDQKGKKRKGTLGVGNGAIFFASESDKAPVQQWPTTNVVNISLDKSKHVFLEISGTSPTSLHFNAGSKETAEAIVAKLESSREISLETTIPAVANTSSKKKNGVSVHFASSPIEITPRAEVEDEDSESEVAAEAGAPAIVLYDFVADGEDEMSVKENEELFVIDSVSSDDWWKCRNIHGEEGVVPASYIDIRKSSPSDSASTEPTKTAPKDVLPSRSENTKLEEKSETGRVRQAGNSPSKPAPRAEASRSEPVKPSEPLAASTPSKRDSLDKPRPGNTRVWHDRTGQFKVEAEFLGVKDGKVRLHKINGVVIEVPTEKMAPDDMARIERLLGKRSSVAVDDDNTPLANIPVVRKRDPPQSRPRPNPPPKRPSYDWFEFFLSAGCDVDDCTRYAASFDRDKIDPSLLPDIKPDTLRALGLREGDIIRVIKAIERRKPSKRNDPSTLEQVRKDEELARQMQELEDKGISTRANSASSPAPNLFAGPNGALKNNSQRRGRPQPSAKTAPTAVDLAAIASVSDQVRSGSPRVGSPAVSAASTPAASTPAAGPGLIDSPSGFDDDAWTPRPSSTAGVKSTTPVPATPIPPPITTTPTAPSVAPAPPVTSAAVQPAPQSPPSIQRPATTTPASPSTSQAPDTFDILAKISQMRPPSAPVGGSQTGVNPSYGQSVPQTTPGYHAGLGMTGSPSPIGQLQAQQTGFSHNLSAPRGPFAPVPTNQALLAPLIPTTTGFQSFVPTRAVTNPSPASFHSPASMVPQATGYQPSPSPWQPGIHGGAMSGPSPFAGSPVNLPTFAGNNFQSGMGAPGNSYMTSQPTGLAPATTGFFSGQPSYMNPNPVVSPPPANHSPASIFASMKSGTFGSTADPQPSDKYNALRQNNGPQPFIPQQTGWTGQNNIQQPGLQQGSFTGWQH